MALFNRTKKEINAKIVYCGPPFAGKSSSLLFVHKKLKPEFRGKIKAMSSQNDRMLFFDFTPAGLGEVEGFRVRFHLYSVQGEVSGESTWKTLLKGVDGIVFVADSASDRIPANRESMKNLGEYLAIYGESLASVPCIVQCNKSDLSGSLAPEEIRAGLECGDIPFIPSSAVNGEGVLQVLSTLLKIVIGSLRAEIERGEAVAAGSGPLESSDEREGRGLQVATVAESGEHAQADESSIVVAREEVPTPLEAEPTIAEMTYPTEGTVEEISALRPVVTGGEFDVEIGGDVEKNEDGALRIPLVVRGGSHEKRFTLTLAVTPGMTTAD